MNSPFSVDRRARFAVLVMRKAGEFTALIAPEIALPSDRRMSRAALCAIIAVLAIGTGSTGWVTVEAVQAIAQRAQRQEDAQ